MDVLIQDIKRWLHYYQCRYIEIIGLDNHINIRNLLINNILAESTNDVVNLYYGLYYYYNHNYVSMIKYYLIAIDLDNCYAAYKLAGHYKSIRNYNDAIKYYLIAYDFNDLNYINYNNELAACYESINDYQNTIKYYYVNIKLGDTYATICLANYFLFLKDYDNVIKCYLDNIKQRLSSLISYACNNNCPEILLRVHNNYLQYITDEYKTPFIDAIILLLRKNIINSSLLLLIANIDLKYFDKQSKLLLQIQKFLDDKKVSMNMCYKIKL